MKTWKQCGMTAAIVTALMNTATANEHSNNEHSMMDYQKQRNEWQHRGDESRRSTAWNGKCQRHGKKQRMFGKKNFAQIVLRHAEKLQLSEEQREKLEQSVVNQRKTMITLRADLEVSRIDLMELGKADTWNRSALEKQIDAISEIEKKIALANLDSLEMVRTTLTDAQWNQLQDWRTKIRGKFGWK